MPCSSLIITPSRVPEVSIKTFNPIYKDEVLDGIYPIRDEILDDKYKVLKIYFEDGEIEMGRPNKIYRVLFDKPVLKDAIFRRKEQNDGE